MATKTTCEMTADEIATARRTIRVTYYQRMQKYCDETRRWIYTDLEEFSWEALQKTRAWCASRGWMRDGAAYECNQDTGEEKQISVPND